MDLQRAVAVATRQIEALYATEAPSDIRLEAFLYDDHLMVWTLTIGFTLANPDPDAAPADAPARHYRVVRVSEADKSVLSVGAR